MSAVAACRTASAPGAVEQFEDIYRQYHQRVVKWVYWKLPKDRVHQAEDYTQEAFRDLWELLLKGKAVDYPWALLKRIAQRRMADFYAQAQNVTSDAVDFADPEMVVIERAAGFRYASGDPELAMLAAELESAMERMRDASKEWRRLHALTAKMRPLGEEYPYFQGELNRKLRQEAARDKAYQDRDDALRELQEACRVVGNLRADLERLGGRWASSCGWPPSCARDGRHRKGTLSDPTVKVCPEGHCLEGVDGVGFLEDGTRVCRACSAVRTAAYRRSKTAAR